MVPITKHNKRENINFLYNKESEVKYLKEEKKDSSKNLKSIAENQKSKKLDNSEAINKTVKHSILNAGTSLRENTPKTNRGYIGQTTNNSIFDPDRIKKSTKTKSNDEKTQELKSDMQKVKAGWKESSKQELIEKLQETINKKDSNITSLHHSDGSSGKKNTLKSSISIFDLDNDFSRIPTKTEGEKSRDETRQRKESKKTDWIETNKNSSMNFMENLLNNLNK